MSEWDWPALAVMLGLAVFGGTGLLVIAGAAIGMTSRWRRRRADADIEALADVVDLKRPGGRR